MHTAAKYREMAEECFQWAATALNDEVRANYLGIAQIWLQAASRLDGGLPIREAVIPIAKQGDGNLLADHRARKESKQMQDVARRRGKREMG